MSEAPVVKSVDELLAEVAEKDRHIVQLKAAIAIITSRFNYDFYGHYNAADIEYAMRDSGIRTIHDNQGGITVMTGVAQS